MRLRSRSCRERGSRDPADDSQCQGSSQETDICNPQTCRGKCHKDSARQ